MKPARMIRGKAMMAGYAAMLLSMGALAQQAPLTLKQSVETAIANNIDVKKSDLAMQTARINWRQGKDNLLPNISGGVEHYQNQGRNINTQTNSYTTASYNSASYSLSGGVTLFNGLRLMNSLKAYQYAYEASKMELQQQKDELTLDVILAYLQILTNIDLLDQAVKQAEVTQQQVDRLEIMNKEGATKPSEFYNMKGTLAQNKVSIINAQNNLNSSKLSLAQLMNVPYQENLQVERLAIETFSLEYGTSVDSIYQVALEQLGLVKATQLREKSAAKNVQATRGNLFPSLSFNSGISTNFSSTALDAADAKIPYYSQLKNNYGTYVGFSLNIPILNNLRYRNNVALSKISLQEAAYTNQTTQIQLKQNIERDYFNMEASKAKYQAMVDQVASYAENFRAAEVLFNAGASTSVDYVIAKNNLDQANTNLIIARYDYVLRTRILDYYQGKLVW